MFFVRKDSQMTPREAVLKIRNSSQNVCLRSLCDRERAGSIPGKRQDKIDGLVRALDAMVNDAKSRLSDSDLPEFEKQLWKEAKCYWLLSGLKKRVVS